MQTAITVAIIAAAASAVGWVVNHILTSRAERARTRLVSQLSHVQKQLELLYGPITFLIYEGRQTWNDLLEKLGRKRVFYPGRQLPPDELKLWTFWIEHEFMPRNAAIQQILAKNTHLITGEKLPASYIEFLNHYNSWRFEHDRWRVEDIPYSWHSKINWPEEFEDEVIATFEYLMKEHAMLIGAVGRD